MRQKNWTEIIIVISSSRSKFKPISLFFFTAIRRKFLHTNMWFITLTTQLRCCNTLWYWRYLELVILVWCSTKVWHRASNQQSQWTFASFVENVLLFERPVFYVTPFVDNGTSKMLPKHATDISLFQLFDTYKKLLLKCNPHLLVRKTKVWTVRRLHFLLKNGIFRQRNSGFYTEKVSRNPFFETTTDTTADWMNVIFEQEYTN